MEIKMKVTLFIVLLGLLTTNPVFSKNTITNYEESNEVLLNPDRGFYHQIGGNHRKPSYLSINAPMKGGISNYSSYQRHATVYRVYFSLKEFREKSIDDKTLNEVVKLLDRAKEKNVTLIPRFYYFWGYENGKPIKSPKKEIIREHVKQLAAVINRYPESISFVEMGFLGAWGEWHSDQYGSGGKHKPFRTELVELILEEFNPNIHFALRYPTDRKKAKNVKGINRVGFHHDCPNYLSDRYPKNKAEKVTTSLPQGGEVCKEQPKGQFGKSSNFDKFYGCEVMIKYFNKFNFDVLNGSNWAGSNSRFASQGCWEEIRDRLGYRFVIKSSKYENGWLEFTVKNVGFGKSFKKRNLEIDTGAKIINTNIDVRNWTSGGEFTERVQVGELNQAHVDIHIEGGVQFANTTGNLIYLKDPK